MTRVFITAASAVIRAGLEAILLSSPALEVVGSSSQLGAIQLDSYYPDVVLVELERAEDVESARIPVLQGSPDAPAVVVLVDLDDAGSVSAALKTGANAVLPRDAEATEIVAAVTAASTGLVVLTRDSVDALLLAAPPTRTRDAGAEPLTPREMEVLSMMAEGVGNKQIARRLAISEHTVKFHVGSILAKLNAASRTEAVTLGVRQGLIMV